MKPPLTPSLLAIILMSLLALSSGGCKEKGCTDKNALNYNSAAGEDDGTCVYCKTTVTPEFALTYNEQDFNSSSQYYNQNVLQFAIYVSHITYNITKCGTDSCVTTLKIKNLVNKTITFSSQIFDAYGRIDTTIYNIGIPPLADIDIGEIQSFASTTDCGGTRVYISFIGNITYH